MISVVWSQFYIRTVRIIAAFILSTISLCSFAKKDTIDVSEYLRIVPLNANTFLHISYIPYENERIQCNGLVLIKNGEAAVFDTPVGGEASNNLLQWIYEDMQAIVTHLVVTHFHEDCISGLTNFIGTGCTTISQQKTCKLAGLKGYNCTQQYFTDAMEITVGGEIVECRYFGAAHTSDNIVCYIPSEKTLFGGCMIKSINASQGNIGDANLNEWSNTVRKVQSAYPKAKRIIPGHGDPGGKKLLKYTINLFAPD